MVSDRYKRRPLRLGRLLEHYTAPHLYFYHRGRKYVVRPSGRRLVLMLKEFSRIEKSPDESLLSLRDSLRDVIASAPPILLSYVLDRFYGNARVLRLVIWIIGKSRSHYSTKAVFAKYEHPDPRVRSEVVRTLRRLSAWRELRIISEKCRYEETRALAVDRKRPAFDQRPEQFQTSHSCSAYYRSRTSVGNFLRCRLAW